MSTEPATVTPTELQRLLAANPGLALLDVRTPEEFLEAHIPQARNEPLDDLQPEALLAGGILPPGQPVYLVCRTDNRATKAAEKFAAAGQASAVVVRGGTLGWIAAGLPVLRSSVVAAILFLSLSLRLLAQDRLLNASLDVSRELFQQINPAFAAQWKADTGREIQIRQSHVGSSQQARAVADGLPADVITLNQVSDVELLANQHLVAADWRSRLPFNAAPYTSISVFVVNPGNPKQIHDWDDLVRPGVRSPRGRMPLRSSMSTRSSAAGKKRRGNFLRMARSLTRSSRRPTEAPGRRRLAQSFLAIRRRSLR